MEQIKIAEELHDTGKQLRKGAAEIFNSAKVKAETERDYRVALMNAIFGLSADGLPATIINDVARGQCADLKFERDLADARYTASREALNSLQAQSSALQTIIKYHSEL